MKRWLVGLVISGYLFTLGFGVFAHAMGYRQNDHPAMYFVVWDMFCGWSAYSSRIHIVAEGQSGKYYELSPVPWGEFKPFGRLGRQHYDVMGMHAARQGANCLAHTRHEPIARMFVVEENWAKKYNLPDELYAANFLGPKDPYSYYAVLKVATPEGAVVQTGCGWLCQQAQRCVADNPRLRGDLQRGKPLFAPSGDRPSNGTALPLLVQDPLEGAPPGSLLGGG